MEFRLLELKIRDFKGLLSFDFLPGGKDADIVGDNGTGKTSVYDAYCWLLFGCDSRDNTAFAIEPRRGDGTVADRDAVTEVEGVFEVYGDELRLLKRNLQKWVRVRGRSELTYQGNTNEYEINGVPCTMKDYNERVSEICDLDMLRILSGVFRFPNLEWTQQRVMLFDMLEMGDDADIMADAGGKFGELRELMMKTGSDFDAAVDMIKRDRKRAMEAVEKLPAMIGESKRYLSERDKLPQKAALDAEKKSLNASIDQLMENRASEMSNVNLAGIMAEMRETEAELRALHVENETYIREQRGIYDVASNISRLRNDEREADRRAMNAKDAADRCKKEVKRLSDLLDHLRKRYEEVQEDVYSGEDICPRCGRKYDESTIQSARQHFEEEKNERLAGMAEEGKALKEKYDTAKAELLEEFKRRDEALKEAAEVSEKLFAIKPFEPSDMDGYAEKLQALTAKHDAAEEKERFERVCHNKIISDIDREIGEKRDRVAEINRILGDIERERTVVERVRQLEDELQEKTGIVDQYDRLLFLADEFTVYKAEKAEEGVNALFEFVKFRLFEKQKNGGMRYCCEATVDGIGYNKNLNSAAKVNAGLDIINAFSKKYGISAPVFVDNAETVTNLLHVPCQMIRLCVEKNKFLQAKTESGWKA